MQYRLNWYQMRTCSIIKKVLRGIRFSIALKEESYTFLVWSVRVEPWHNHDLPWQIPYKAGRTENWLTQSVEAFNCKLKCCFWSPTCICNTNTHNYLKNLLFSTPTSTTKSQTRCSQSSRTLSNVMHRQNKNKKKKKKEKIHNTVSNSKTSLHHVCPKPAWEHLLIPNRDPYFWA